MKYKRISLHSILWGCLAALVVFVMPLSLYENVATGQQGVLKVVMDDNYPPYVFRDVEGTLVGILVDQWALWEKKTGIKVEIAAKDWADALSSMQAGHHDVIDTIFKNPEREKIYDFSKPYERLDAVIFFNKNLPGITGIESLRGFTVGVKRGDHAVSVLQKAGISGIMEYNSYESMIVAARDRNMLIFIMEKPPGLYFLYKNGLKDEIRFSEPLYSGEFHRAVHKGNVEVLRKVEAGFAAISRSEYDAIHRKWFGDSPTKAHFDFRLIAGAVGGILVVAVLLFTWSWTLQRTVRRKTAALSSSERKYRELLTNLAIGVIVFDAGGKSSLWNTTALKTLELTEKQLVGEEPLPAGWEYLSAEEKPLDLALLPFRSVFRTAGAVREFVMGVRLTGSCVKWLQVDAFPDFDDYGRIEQVVMTFSDMTARRETEQSLLYISFHDAMTGVYNRAYFEEELRRLDIRRKGTLTIAIADVDGLKQVNDNLGHTAGDELLIRAAQFLQRCVRHEDIVARIGGDEFAIILRNSDEVAVDAIFSRLRQALVREKNVVDGHPALCLSIGYAFSSGTNTPAMELFKIADQRMYREKAERRCEQGREDAGR